MIRHRLLILLPSILCLLPSVRSAQAPLALTGPEIIKLDWGARSLCTGDLNGDNLPDIAVANNDRATIELLYQLKPGEQLPRVPSSLTANRWEPIVEDARFRKATITTGLVMFDLAIGDIDNDGLPDLVYTGSPQNLTLRLQQPDGNWTEKKIPEAPAPNQLTGSLRIADLDHDGRADIAMLGNKELAIFYQQTDGTLAAPERYTLPDDNCYGLEICDIDGDTLPDLLYLCNGPRQTARVRLQTPGRQFGPELSYEIKNSRCTLQILQQADAAQNRHATFAFAQEGTGQLEEFTLRPAHVAQTAKSASDTSPLPTLHPRIFSPRPGAKTPFAYALGNFTAPPRPPPSLPGDTFHPKSTPIPQSEILSSPPAKRTPGQSKPSASLQTNASGDAISALPRSIRNPQSEIRNPQSPDLVVSDPDAAQVYLYPRQPDNTFTTSQKSPVFSDARSLAAGDWYNEGRDALFVASPKEQTVGVSRYNDGRFEYPKPLPVTGRPLALAYGDFDGQGNRLLAILLENKGKRAIELWTRDGDTAERVKTIEITNLKTDPRALRLLDANQDGLLDIAIFTPLDAMRLYVQTRDAALTFAEASASTDFRRGLVDNLDASALTLGDINNDGTPELITATTGFARALRLGPAGLEVLDQYNARTPAAEIATALIIPAHGAAAPNSAIRNPKSKIETPPTVVLYDRKAEQFQLLRPDAAGLYQIADTAPAGKIDVTGAEVRPAANEAFIFGRDRFWWLPLGQRDLAPVTLSTHTTDLPNISYADVIAGDLDNDGQPEIVCVDPVKNLLEILRRAPDGIRWDSQMHFKVFEVDQHYQGRRGTPLEPRETVIANLTADPNGKKSILLLVHDRILIYPQQQ